MAGIFDFQARKMANQAKWESVSWEEVAIFIGPNAHRFEHVFAKQKEKILESGAGIAAGWSWPALLASFAWFAYRKQWALAAAILAVPLVFSLVLPSSGGGAGVGVAIAIYAKSFYVTSAVDRIAKIKAFAPAGLSREEALASAGGVSMTGGAVGGFLLALMFAAVLVPLLSGR